VEAVSQVEMVKSAGLYRKAYMWVQELAGCNPEMRGRKDRWKKNSESYANCGSYALLLKSRSLTEESEPKQEYARLHSVVFGESLEGSYSEKNHWH
jgi:hypothetical protein